MKKTRADEIGGVISNSQTYMYWSHRGKRETDGAEEICKEIMTNSF